MDLRKTWISAVLLGGLAFGLTSTAQAAEFQKVALEVASGGTMNIAFPKHWDFPVLETEEGVTSLKFGPLGPKSKPVFHAHIAALTANTIIPPQALMQLTQKEIDEVRAVAEEANIPITDIEGDHSSGHYFSFTLNETNPGEFKYMTLAVIGSEQMLVKCYFFSNDGAPDFHDDAIQLLQSIKYTAPTPAAPESN